MCDWCTTSLAWNRIISHNVIILCTMDGYWLIRAIIHQIMKSVRSQPWWLLTWHYTPPDIKRTKERFFHLFFYFRAFFGWMDSDFKLKAWTDLRLIFWSGCEKNQYKVDCSHSVIQTNCCDVFVLNVKDLILLLTLYFFVGGNFFLATLQWGNVLINSYAVLFLKLDTNFVHL